MGGKRWGREEYVRGRKGGRRYGSEEGDVGGRGTTERKEGRWREDRGKMGKRCWYQDVCH